MDLPRVEREGEAFEEEKEGTSLRAGKGTIGSQDDRACERMIPRRCGPGGRALANMGGEKAGRKDLDGNS